MYQHIGDPDWKDQWWRRNMIPQYELGYKRSFIKFRFFSSGEYSLSDREDYGRMYWPTVLGPDGQQKEKDTITYLYAYKMTDLILSYAVLHTHIHDLKIGVGGAHRVGYEASSYEIPAGFFHPVSEGQLIERNQWGVVGELSYSVNFLKYAIFSLETACRVYPNGPSLFTAGAALGVRIRHQVPAKPNNWLPFQRQ